MSADPLLELTEDMILEEEGPGGATPVYLQDPTQWGFTMDVDQWEIELTRALAEATSSTRVERGTGFCNHRFCLRYLRAYSIFQQEGDYICRECGRPGKIVPERGIPERQAGEPFAEVRVEYSYDTAMERFREVAVVSDDSWAGRSGSYTLQAPTISTQRRAFKTAEVLLNTLNQGLLLDSDLESPPRTYERVLDMGKDNYYERLKDIERELRDNSFLCEQVVPDFREEEKSSATRGDQDGR